MQSSPGENVLVFCEEIALLERAAAFAKKIGTSVSDDCGHGDVRQSKLIVNFSKAGVSLRDPSGKIGGAVAVDFVGGKLGYRRKHPEPKPLLAKAVGLQPKLKPQVWDMTAGLGQDAYVLAQLGCEVLMHERHPIVFELLQSGLEIAREQAEFDESLRAAIDRLSLSADNSVDRMMSINDSDKPDVIYLDPMFPERVKSAKVKKAMQMFHQIVGADIDSADLLPAALAAARYRVVVKRSKQAPSLDGKPVPLQLYGKAMRFDVYPLKKMLPA